MKIYKLLFLLLFFISSNLLFAEGSVNFRNSPGKRMFYWANEPQQIKVFAKNGEIINVGASHVGVNGGIIEVYKPSGELYTTFNNTGANAGMGIIHNDVEELAGPNGGGTTNGAGYIPGIVSVDAASEGIWSIVIRFPETLNYVLIFNNLENNQPWDQATNQPTTYAVIAWDVTVTKNGAGNQNGTAVNGRVFSNFFKTIISGNQNTNSNNLYVLTKDGFVYLIDYLSIDPYGSNLFSNNVGLVDSTGQPTYKSYLRPNTSIINTSPPYAGNANNFYLYDPASEDIQSNINNKIFFNYPSSDLPLTSTTTNVLTGSTFETWLLTPMSQVIPDITNVSFYGYSNDTTICQQNLSVSGHGGVIYFTSNVIGGIKLVLDFNSNGIYTDPEDITYYKNVEQGQDSIIWDGRNGLGEVVPPNTVIPMNYSVNVKGGEIHIILSDIENNPGGVGFTRLNGSNSPSSIFYYDHSLVGGTVSGGGTVPAPTSLPYTYTDNFGNEKYLDYWSYTDYGVLANGTFNIFVAEQCQTELAIDTDHDSIPDIIDLDDDNDGITDKNEFCNPTGGFSCLGLGFDPSGDEDNDKIPNYLDANDPTVQNGCNDDDNNGTCDTILPIYDTDGDNVPDHLDLDSDNDGITDLVESGNLQVDLNGDGIIDGNPSAFGENGLFNLIENNDGQDAVSTYTIIDFDNDGIPDHDDLDADNDGIFDVNEAGFALSDSNNDGRIDDGNGNPPLVSASGLAPIIDPAVTGNPIPYPVDTDHDGVSDWHDHDSDNDGIFDVLEGGNPDIDNDGFIGGGTPTVNANGVATAAGNHPTNVPTDTDGDGTPDYRDLDSDGDGLSDVSEARNPDGDLDWIIDSGNPVVDIFGVSTTSGAQSHPSDLDGDGIPDFRDIDRDGDSVPDAFECETGHPCPDTDHDGLVDADDLDTDNDEMPDALECPDGTCPDYNQNGIREWREYMCNPFTTVPIIQNFTDNITLCEGQNIDLNASNNTTLPLGGPVTYTWRGPNNFEYTSTAPVNGGFPLVIDNVNSSYEGSYVLTVYTTRGCPSAPRSVLVQINDKPAAPNLTALDNNLCENGNLWLNTNAYDGNVVSYQWYFKDTNGDVSNLGTTAVPNFNISNLTQDHEGTYYVSVAVDGCNSNNSNLQPISVVDPISGAIAQSNVEGSACPNELVELNVPVITGATYLWEGPIGFFSEQPNPIISSFSYPNEGTYNVYTYIDGCLVNKSSVNIAVQDSILAADDFINSIEGVASQNINILENDAFGAIGEINIVITVQPKNGTLTLNNDGTVNYTSLDNFIGDDTFSYTICRVDCPNICAQARVNINVDNNANESIFIPNVITPNGDGKNDNFKILNIEDYPNNKITIYNRYGDVVFTKPGYLNTWNGTWNDQALPAGTYFYYLLLDTNDTNPRTGYITIVR